MTFFRLSLFIKILALIGLTICTDLATAADKFAEPTFRVGFIHGHSQTFRMKI